MTSTQTNPYAETKLFFGRQDELVTLTRELTRGRSALAAVMGGRGMGKTSFARQLRLRLKQAGVDDIHTWARTPNNIDEFLQKLSQTLDFEFTGKLLDDELVEAVEARAASRTILLLDEVDALIPEPHGHTAFENLRIAWERLLGRLGVVILGGSSLYELLESKVSPFLRNAVFIDLQGLSAREAAEFARVPLALELPQELLHFIWQETAGHPALLNDIMKSAFDKASDEGRAIVDVLHGIMHDRRFVDAVEIRYFQIWWNNLRPAGQSLYRSLAEQGRPIALAEVAQYATPPADSWLRVLKTTGVAVQEGDTVVLRGQLFFEWARRNRLLAETLSRFDTLGIEFDDSASDFERKACIATARWAIQLPESAGLALLTKADATKKGNDRLLPEAHFQLGLSYALGQHGWVVDQEPWSSEGRTDIKISERSELGARCCVELKIWGRNNYKIATEQVLGYTTPTDDFAIVVMLDRAQASLTERYERLLEQERVETVRRAADIRAQPKLVTNHVQHGRMVRVYHYLVQLPGDP